MFRGSGSQVVRWLGGQVVIKSCFFNAPLSKFLVVTKLFLDFFTR